MSEENKKDEVKVVEPGMYEIFFKGSFDSEYMEEVFSQIHTVPPNSNLIVWINSGGGSVHVGMMLKDKLEAKNLNVTFISHLFNASMGALMPQIGDFIRLTYHNAVHVYHEPTLRSSGVVDVHDNLYQYSIHTVDAVKKMLIDKVGMDKKDIKKYWGKEYTTFGYQLLEVGEHGLVDGLILKEIDIGIFLIKTRDGNKIIDVSKHKRSDIKDLPVVE